MTYIVQILFNEYTDIKSTDVVSTENIDKIENKSVYIKTIETTIDSKKVILWYPISILYRKNKIKETLSKKYGTDLIFDSLKLFEENTQNN